MNDLENKFKDDDSYLQDELDDFDNYIEDQALFENSDDLLKESISKTALCKELIDSDNPLIKISTSRKMEEKCQ